MPVTSLNMRRMPASLLKPRSALMLLAGAEVAYANADPARNPSGERPMYPSNEGLT